jgi:Flp pilus assembly protein TadG
MPTQEEIKSVLIDLEMQLAAASDTAKAAADLARQYNNENGGSLDAAGFRRPIDAIDIAIQTVPQLN